MKVVIDSNVLISAVAGRGLREALSELCLEEHEIVVCEEILADVREKLTGKIKVPRAIADQFVAFLKQHAAMVQPLALPARVCRDPDDVVILGLAAASNAEFVITGDDDLLALGAYRGIRIVNPRRFWELSRRPQ